MCYCTRGHVCALNRYQYLLESKKSKPDSVHSSQKSARVRQNYNYLWQTQPKSASLGLYVSPEPIRLPSPVLRTTQQNQGHQSPHILWPESVCLHPLPPYRAQTSPLDSYNL